jgi:peroxiredoxin
MRAVTALGAPAPGTAGPYGPGSRFPDLSLPDHTGRERTLLELAGGDPLVLVTARGWWCPKEQRYLRSVVTPLQDEFEVAYTKLAVLSVDPPEVQAAFRAGLGARYTFLSDHERRHLDELGLRETTDTVHHPYRPAAFSLFPDLTVHRAYNGYWYWGRATADEIRRDMREISMLVRPDWEPPSL